MKTNVFATIFLIFLSVRKATAGSVVDLAVTTTHNGASMQVTTTSNTIHTGDFVIGSVSATPSGDQTFSPNPLPTTAASSFTISATGLAPATQYRFTVGDLKDSDGSTALSPDMHISGPICTKPEPVSGLMVVPAETNTAQITISWANPMDSTPVTMEVLFDDYATVVSDATSTEYLLTESASSVAFTADQSGKCKVKLTVAAGEDCAGEESEVEVDCAASNPAPGSGNLVVTSTHKEATIVVTKNGGGDFVVASISARPTADETFSPDPLPTSAASSFTIRAMGLAPATQYRFIVGGLKDSDGSTALSPDIEISGPICTKPEPVSGLMVVPAETNTTQIKIRWASPMDSTPVTLEVLFDDYATVVSDATSTEYILTESASTVGFTADQSGKCKVKLTVAAGEDCANEESEVEVDCAASSPASESDGSAAVKLLPGTLLLCLLYQILAA